MSIHRSIRRSVRLMRTMAVAGSLSVIGAAAPVRTAHGDDVLPPGGETSWEIRDVEEIVTFALFDPRAPGIVLPKGLQFILAKDVPMPEVQEHLKEHPEHAERAFSIVEITRQKGFLIDGRGPKPVRDGAIGLWIAPVDPSGLVELVPEDVFATVIANAVGSVLALGLWVPDREYVAYMIAKGHYGDYGGATLTTDNDGLFHGEIRLDDLQLRVSASPLEEVRDDPESGTQVLFMPGKEVARAAVLAGAAAKHRECDAQWSASGSHPLSGAVFVGATYLTTYGVPLTGRLYRLRK